MSRTAWLVVAVAGAATLLFLASAGRADIPAPPVNQTIGFKDVVTTNADEATCRGCHTSGVPNRHHLLYNTGPLPPANLWYSKSDPTAPDPIPYPDANGDGVRDTKYSCITCHGPNFQLVRNCGTCHQRSPHHAGITATSRNCTPCHGSLVNDLDDGHYVPTYSPSLVTPRTSHGEGLPLNARGEGAGACDYCHDADAATPHLIVNNHDTHHLAKFTDFGSKCVWCHGTAGRPASPYYVRENCDGCHGPTSLHNIQVSSKTPPGPVIVGGELAGYGHVGRDNGPGDSDCWGCHGFAMASAPGAGPVIPTVNEADKATITAGASTTVVLTGAAFINTMGANVYESGVTLTAPDGTSVTLTPDVIVDQGSLAVTIPAGATKPGNYAIKAKKADFSSNPAVLSAIPKVRITSATATADRVVTIKGAGFAGYAAGSGLYVNGTNSAGNTIRGTVVSWAPGKIVAKFGSVPTKVNVRSVFGKASRAVAAP